MKQKLAEIRVLVSRAKQKALCLGDMTVERFDFTEEIARFRRYEDLSDSTLKS